jgi:hypothetical protein
MVRRTTKTNAALGGLICRLGRRRVGKPTALIGRLLLGYALVVGTAPATAQVTGFNIDVALPANPNSAIGTSNLVIGNQAIGTLDPLNPVKIDGQGGQGYFVTSGSSSTTVRCRTSSPRAGRAAAADLARAVRSSSTPAAPCFSTTRVSCIIP